MELSIFTNDYFMRQALQEAHHAFGKGEIPVGAVLVCNNRIIARAHNQTERLLDVTAHAEILAITAASTFLGSKYLKGCILYVTLEPCIMCAGALAWSQLDGIIFGAKDKKRGFLRYGTELLHPSTQCYSGVLEKECSELIQQFFKKKR